MIKERRLSNVKILLSLSCSPGVTFSVLASLDGLGAFVGPLLLQLLYSMNVEHGDPGVPFFAAAAIGFVAEILAL